ncbi:sensor histidine kinase [Cohnella terricola]|uniref:Sensor histidine kinase n=1 Tax=Cohnella terricola TaxID=1289167 RepID=A0A559JWE6_9BACL|nr:sensor histidine kinase [Cohnella terricola]TVY04214.1 sensor histidine kinase [Cohnella terricola]
MSNRIKNKLISSSIRFIEYFSSSIKKKLLLMMMLITCVPVIAITAVAISESRKNLEAEIRTTNQSSIIWSGQFIDEKLKLLDNLMFSVMADLTITRYLEGALDSDMEPSYIVQSYILNKLNSVYLPNLNLFDQISVFSSRENKSYTMINGESRIIAHSSHALPLPWDRLGNLKLAYYMEDQQSPHFHMYRTMFKFIDRSILGGISIHVNWSMLDPILQSVKSEENSLIFIMDREGRAVHGLPGADYDSLALQDIHAALSSGSGEAFFKTKSYYVFQQAVGDGSMFLVKAIPTSAVLESNRRTLWFSVSLGIGLLIFSLAASILLANKATNPILKLARAISFTAESNHDEYIETKRNDEIGLLEQKYSEMIRARYRIYIEKRNAQFKALQAQINPHFLHNTLQSLGAMAVARNVPEVYQIIQTISSNFRYTMTTGDDFVTLMQEIEHVDNYLTIQNFRFKDKIEKHFQIDESAKTALLPILILQPIVENAFEHGFQHTKAPWIIKIDAVREADIVRISIMDNGIGIPPERLAEINESLLSDPGDVITFTNSMALRNINARIGIHFGEPYGLTLQNHPGGRGTLVTITLPYIPSNK